MAEDLIRYDVLAQDALRGMLRKVLTEASRAGLPGEHHFYIAFDTRAPGVRISPRLKERYPDEITIVLQHQFWDLMVAENYFEVGLAFGGVPEKLVVPFTAIKGFFDPSVEFGLQFDVVREDLDDLAETDDEAIMPTQLRPITEPDAEIEKPAEAPAAEAPVAAGGTASVVSLDAFRKKT